MNRTIKILTWNSNGLQQHHLELEAILNIRNIDVCLISETHFTKQSLIKFKGYKIYHTIHPDNSARGGSAVIIKENILHYEEIKYQTEEIQATAVNIQTYDFPVVVAAIYSPPRHSIKKDQYINFFKNMGNTFIVGGDYNAKNEIWGSRLTSPKGKQLFEAIKELKCDFISTGKPTYWPTDPNKIPDLIDFFVYKNISCNFLQIDESHELNSDHTALVLTLSQYIIEKPKNATLCNKFTDWDYFKKRLEDKIDLKASLKNQSQIDIETNKLVVNIQQSAWESTPEMKKKMKGYHYPTEIRDMIRDKRKARRMWQQSRNPKDKTNLNNLTQRIRREIKELKNKSLKSYLENLSNEKSSDYSLWKATQNIKRPIMQIPPIKVSNGNWVRSNEDKAHAFAELLKNTFTNDDNQSDDNLENINCQIEENIHKTTAAEVSSEIKSLTKKKSPGFDLINGEILNQLPKKAIMKFTNIINASFRLQYVPTLWKVAEVIMIPKPGKPPHELTSYRPISLLPIMSKIFEKILLRRMYPIIDNQNLIPNHQFGFRTQHSTIDQVHRITSVIESALEDKKVCSAVFLDVAQAFDKVWHEGLIHKIKSMFSKQMSKILESYLTDRYFRIKQEDAYSELKAIGAGVPQGSVLGPVLYLLYTNDIPVPENDTIATYADDTAIMAIGENHDESVAKVQRAVTQIENWTKKWRIKLNESKSVHVDFTNKKINYKEIYISNNAIPHANTAKYLGMTLDTKLRWKAHVKKKREELGLRYKKMYWLIGKHSTLSIANKILLYKQILKPVWTYGIQLWGCTKPSNIQIIQRFQNKVLRNIVNAPWYIRNTDIHRDLKVEDVESEIKKFAKSHEQRLHQHVNVEAIQLLDTTDIVRRLKRTKPFELI